MTRLQPITTLLDAVDGSYLSKTASGSIHLIDLDDKIVARFPSETGDGSELRRDNEVVQLIDLVDVTIGRDGKFIIYLGTGPYVTMRTTEVVVELYRQVADDADPASSPTAA